MVNGFSAPEDGWFVNSYYFRTPDGIFVFDTQLLVDYASALLDQIVDEAQASDITAVFISHPHPDHYNGAPLFSRRTKAAFYSTRATAKIIARRAPRDLQALKAQYKRRLPHTFLIPSEVFKDRLEIKWKKAALQLIDMGPAESQTGLIGFIPHLNILLAGDLVYNRVHLKFYDGSAQAWRQALVRLKSMKIKRVYPGHGAAAGPEIIPHLIRYIDHFQLAIDYFGRGKEALDAEDRRRIVGAMCDKYPDYLAPENLEASVDVEFARQRGAKVA